MREADLLKSEFSNILSRSQVGSFMYILNQIDTEMSKDFLTKLCTGLGIDKSSSIYVLRKKLIEDKSSKYKMSFKDKLAIIIKAWNYYRVDRPCRFLRWNKEK